MEEVDSPSTRNLIMECPRCGYREVHIWPNDPDPPGYDPQHPEM